MKQITPIGSNVQVEMSRRELLIISDALRTLYHEVRIGGNAPNFYQEISKLDKEVDDLLSP